MTKSPASDNSAPRPIRARQARGSVLVFAIVMLSILTVLGVAFLLLAEHAVASARSGVASPQVDQAAEAGHIRALNFLKASVRGAYTSTPDGVVKLDPAAGTLILTQTTNANTQGAGFNSTVNMFEHNLDFDSAHGIKTPTFALLSSRYPDPAFPGAPVYSTAPMRLTIDPPDRAAGYYVRSDMTDFYTTPTKGSRKALSPVGTIRAKSYQWVRDLDANFHANPSLWGINVQGVPNAPGPQVIAANILTTLQANSDLKETLSAADLTYLANLAPSARFDSVNTLAQSLPTYEAYAQGKITADVYELWRADIETYFTPFIDAQRDPSGNYLHNSSGALISQSKPGPAAININTAPIEVIQALLSQIPDSPGPNVTFGSTGRALLLARRIVAKRPFLCRMEFEDFAASLLSGDSADLKTPLGMVNFAIQKRISGEISLSQYLEIPGIQNDHPIYQLANTTPRMAQRFAYFLDDTSGFISADTPKRANCVMTLKAFNNLLNSVSANLNAAQQYSVNMVPGQAGAPNQPVLAPAPGGSLDGIQLGGDDTIVNGVVTSGPNGIAETAVFGYSYYSHDDTTPIYKPNLVKASYNYDASKLQDPFYMGKFVYGDPSALPDKPAFEPAGIALYKNYQMIDLQKWSCVGNGHRSGYYDMFFNPNDVMLYELGQKSDATPADATEPVITSLTGAALLTNANDMLTNDDVQETLIGEDATVNDGIVALPGPNGTIETPVNRLNEYTGQPLAVADQNKIVKAIRLSVNFPTTWPDPASNDNFYHSFVDDNDYIISTDGTPLTTVPAPPDPDNPIPKDIDMFVDIIVAGVDGLAHTSVPDDVPNPPMLTQIGIGKNLTCDTFVWGPLRASQRPLDQLLPSCADQIPSATSTSGNGTGDVAWGPPIAFRSRFFTVYVLAQGLNTHPALTGSVTCATAAGTAGPLVFTSSGGSSLTGVIVSGSLIAVASSVPSRKNVYVADSVVVTGSTAIITLATPLVEAFTGPATTAIYSFSVLGERRIESAYDAFNDEVLSRHSPLTDKRSLGDP